MIISSLSQANFSVYDGGYQVFFSDEFISQELDLKINISH